MIALLILALAMSMLIAGVMMDARTAGLVVVKNAIVIGGILIVLGFTTLIIGP